jgi:HSP20 family molecular chaperone IbpA
MMSTSSHTSGGVPSGDGGGVPSGDGGGEILYAFPPSIFFQQQQKEGDRESEFSEGESVPPILSHHHLPCNEFLTGEGMLFIQVDLPGCREDQITLEMGVGRETGYLFLTVRRDSPLDTSTGNHILKSEVWSGVTTRCLILPQLSEPSSLKVVSLAAGVLTLSCEKKPASTVTPHRRLFIN